MTMNELLQLAEAGKLKIGSRPYREYTRRQWGYNWDANEGEKIFRKPDVKYKVYYRYAKTDDMDDNCSFKIGKSDYKLLSKAGAIEIIDEI